MNRNQELLDKLLTALDLEFKDATEGMEDGWYIYADLDPKTFYGMTEVQDGKFWNGEKWITAYGQLAGPILGR